MRKNILRQVPIKAFAATLGEALLIERALESMTESTMYDAWVLLWKLSLSLSGVGSPEQPEEK
jgi:hypothetical protein